jgi:hypothetical protein
MYRVEVSKKDPSGRETIPPRYNQKTVLGVEVGPEGQTGVETFRLRGN